MTMRIVHVTTGFLGLGLSGKVQILVRTQKALGHDVTVVAAQIVDSDWLSIASTVSGGGSRDARSPHEVVDGVTIRRLPAFIHYADLYLCKGVRQLISQLHPDIWHLHEPAHGLPAQVANIVKDTAPIVVDQHQYVVSFSKKAVVRIEYSLVRRHFVNATYRWADEVVSVTKAGASFLSKRHHISENRITVIPLGVDNSIFQFNQSDRTHYRKKLGLQDHHILVINTGKLQPFKRHADLLQGFALAYRKNPNLRLLMVGEGEKHYLEILDGKAREYAIHNAVLRQPFVGERDLSGFFSAADIATWPLFPTISISQAISCGVPLVLSYHPSQSHFLDYGCGVGFPPGDTKRMGECFTKLASEGELRKKIHDHNVRFARERLYPEKIAGQYQKVYLEAEKNWIAKNLAESHRSPEKI